MGSHFLTVSSPPWLVQWFPDSVQLYFCKYLSELLPGAERVLCTENWPRPPQQRMLAASEVGVFPPLRFQPYACFHILAGVVCVCVCECVCVCVCGVVGRSSLLQGGSLSEIIRSASSMTLWILPCPAIGWEPLIIAVVINLSPRNQPETIRLILCRPLGNAETLGENCIFVWKESLWTTSARFNWAVSLMLTERGQRGCGNSHRSDLTDGLVTLCSMVLFLPFEIFSRKGVNRRVLGQKR